MARKWMKFFLDAGIPKDSSAEYAVNFEQNRMELDMLPELDKDTLRFAFEYIIFSIWPALFMYMKSFVQGS